MGFLDLKPVSKALFKTGKYADMVISCQNHEFRVHRVFVCSHSRFFDAAIRRGFKEGIQARIDLPEDDVETIHCVLSFCYTRDYKHGKVTIEEGATASEADKVSRKHLQIYYAADKFGIQELKALAIEHIVACLSIMWGSPVLPEVLQDIWRSTLPHEKDLRDAIAKIVATGINHYLGVEEGTKVLNANPELTTAVLSER